MHFFLLDYLRSDMLSSVPNHLGLLVPSVQGSVTADEDLTKSGTVEWKSGQQEAVMSQILMRLKRNLVIDRIIRQVFEVLAKN